MPGKVNPSIPEMVNQVCFQVIGCDATIAAADAGQLELNVMMPGSVERPARGRDLAPRIFSRREPEGLEADEARCRELLDRTRQATALSPISATPSLPTSR